MESGPAIILKRLDAHVTAPGMVRLFGGAAFILGYGRARQTEDADLVLDDAECLALMEEASFAEAVERTNAELAGQGLYLTHIFDPSQLILTPRWREACRPVALAGLQRLLVLVLGPVDLALTKLARGDAGDMDDVRFLLETKQLDGAALREGLAVATVPEVLAEVHARTSVELLRLLEASGQ